METKNIHTSIYPFTAIIGQELVKKALLLNCIKPSIGGVLLSGEKGTAKSTIVRSLASLLPDVNVVTLPLNATEDMVLGGIDIDAALKEGQSVFQPGLLTKAHRHILYIDEVNLLSESIINIILDAASSGICTVEREGISYTYPAEFILIGSMNPEEGGLTPQILDRFGFYVDVRAETNIRSRMEIVSNRLAFETNPIQFIEKYKAENKLLSERLQAAQALISKVDLSESTIRLIADFCHQSFVAGHRGDMAFCNGVIAHAALENRLNATREDIALVKDLALAHRIRTANQVQNEENNQEEPDQNNDQQENKEEQKSNNKQQSASNSEESSKEQQQPESNILEDNEDNTETSLEEEQFEIENLSLNTDIIEPQKDRTYRNKGNGKRSKTKTNSKHGHYVKVRIPNKDISDLAFDATLRAAAPFQKIRKKNGTAVSIQKQDIRVKVREKRVGNTILFLLDTSGSMGINRRMTEAKGAVFELLKESYKKRDTVGLMRFNQSDAKLELQPTRSLDLAHKKLKDIKVGGKTPLANGISSSTELMKAIISKDPESLPVVLILSDGRANHCSKGKKPMQSALEEAQKASKEPIRFIVIDTETGFIRLGMAQKLAKTLEAEYYKLEDLKEIKQIIGSTK
ncbi:MAG: AAA family ATPase [Carboxylicivirga sp.]|nr:AAA family ATPase [Carboxylicivirga sp.]